MFTEFHGRQLGLSEFRFSSERFIRPIRENLDHRDVTYAFCFQVESLLFELLQENAHVHPPLGVEDADLKTQKTPSERSGSYIYKSLLTHTQVLALVVVPLPRPPHAAARPGGILKLRWASCAALLSR